MILKYITILTIKQCYNITPLMNLEKVQTFFNFETYKFNMTYLYVLY